MGIKIKKINGKKYYYLDKNVRIGENNWKTFTHYMGPFKPSRVQVEKAKKRLDNTIRKYIEEKIVKPKTRFIDKKTALKLERIKTSQKRILATLDKTSKENYLKRQREAFITNTNAIEGSQLTFEQTKKILQLNKSYNTQDREELEVINMENCLEAYDQALEKKIGLSEKLILSLHLLLLKTIPKYEGYAGIWRPVNVYIRGSKYNFPAWRDIPELISELLKWYEENKDQIHPVELAAIFHSRFVTIHPFADGNGRMARLLMNYLLQANGFPFTDIPFSKRDEYFTTQEEGHFGKYKLFVQFLIDEIGEEFAVIKKKIAKKN